VRPPRGGAARPRLQHKETVKVGRTHGIHAEPTTFGHRMADLAFAMARSRDRLLRAREASPSPRSAAPSARTRTSTRRSSRCWPSGSGLTPAPAATQVVLRDGISEWVSALAIIATVCEAFALEVRHGQRTEVRELSEPFGKGQKGSSAMPHKKNPIASERIAGMARVVRAQVVPVLEGIPLWHERDISHSSTERIALPDAATGTDYLLHLTTRLVTGLVVDPERMRANLESSGGLIYTSTVLLELVEGGLSREDAYAFVQRAAMRTWETGRPFRQTLTEEAADAGEQLDEARLDEVCRPERYVERLAPVFERLAALT
jgi:adenylosuccinate lyase